MSTTPMTPAQWRSQLKKWKVPVREMPGWDRSTSGRDDETGLIFGPVFGAMIHHTGDDAPDSADRRVISEGRSDLPGPLAHGGGNDDGVIDIHTWKRANHAGGGDPDVLRVVKAEDYGSYPPPTDKHQGESGAVDGNDCFYGYETYYSGSHKMTQKQYDSMIRWAAAICDFHKWTAKSVIGHKEWSDWKWDPGSHDMKTIRTHVQFMLDRGPSATVPGSPVPGPAKTLAITRAIAENIGYEKALLAVGHPGAQDEKAAFVKVLKQQRAALRLMERK